MLSEIASERFEVRSRLGAGSFGTVYEAFDLQRNRAVALKVLEHVSPDSVARFKREFRSLTGIRHPNLASLYELLVLGGQWLLTMELVRGSELLEHLAFVELQESLIQNRVVPAEAFDGDATITVSRYGGATPVSPLYLAQIRSTFQQLAQALAVLHAHGVVHRDVKPSNIMIARDGRVVVLDFGLAVEASLDDSLDRRSVVGTPGYMSPEQIAASPPTAASDWYSFGVLLHQALTGQLPFEGATPIDILYNQMNAELVAPARAVPGLPEDLSSLAFDCLQRDPARRPADAEILARLGIEDFDPVRVDRSRKRTEELIGRGTELRTLAGWIDRIPPDEPRMILINGPPGVGKSALLDHFLNETRASGEWMILAGRCQPWESLPFNAADAIVDALARGIRRDAAPAVLDILGRSVAVTELFPALAGHATTVGDETVAIPRGDRLISRAAVELRALVHAAAGDRNIMLVLDDSQWGDYQSARFFRALLEEPAGRRVALVLVYTRNDWRTSLFLQGLDLLATRPAPRELRLAELSRAMTARLIRALTGSRGKRIVDRVFTEAGGNPMLIGVAAEGDSLAAGVETRLSSLSAAARHLFASVAAAEGPVELTSLESGLELIEADEALRSLAAQRLVRVRRTGNLTEIDVYHDRLRDTPLRSSAPSATLR